MGRCKLLVLLGLLKVGSSGLKGGFLLDHTIGGLVEGRGALLVLT